jgi:predicted TIM-barrel fold metal-dependent hydrolase
MAYEFFGADNIVMGSDFPLPIGDLEAAVPSIEQMNISREEKDKILGENVARLLKLNT